MGTRKQIHFDSYAARHHQLNLARFEFSAVPGQKASTPVHTLTDLTQARPIAARYVVSAPPLFAAVVALHVIAWTLVPALVTSNAMLDIIEGLAWGHEWQLGYHKGPPLFAWLVELAAVFSGKQLWPIYLESQICIAIAFFGVWQLGRRVCTALEALLGVMVLEGVYYFSFPTPEFNEIVLQMPFAALLGWILHRALREDRMADWVFAGALAGAGLWARYSMGAYLVPMALFVLLHPLARRRLHGVGPYLALGVAILIFLPHARWIVASDFISLHYVAERAGSPATVGQEVASLGRFVGAQALALLPAALLVASLLRRRTSTRFAAGVLVEPFDQSYLAMLALGPCITAAVLALATGHGLRSMWGGPLWCFIGLFAVTRMRPLIAPELLPRFALVWTLVFSLAVTAFAASQLVGSPATKREKKAHFPGAALAAAITAQWHERTGQKLRFVVGRTWLAGNVAFYSADRPSLFIDAEPRLSPWVEPDALSEAGAVLVWSIARDGEALPTGLAAVFPAAESQEPIALRSRNHNRLIGWAIVLPQANPSSTTGVPP